MGKDGICVSFLVVVWYMVGQSMLEPRSWYQLRPEDFLLDVRGSEIQVRSLPFCQWRRYMTKRHTESKISALVACCPKHQREWCKVFPKPPEQDPLEGDSCGTSGSRSSEAGFAEKRSLRSSESGTFFSSKSSWTSLVGSSSGRSPSIAASVQISSRNVEAELPLSTGPSRSISCSSPNKGPSLSKPFWLHHSR